MAKLFIKHYVDASNSVSLENFIEQYGFEMYGRYWRLLELLGAIFDGEDTFFRLPSATVRRSLRIRSWNELDTVLIRLSTISGINAKRIGNVLEIEAPILLELQHRDFKTARKSRANPAQKPHQDIRYKIKDKRYKNIAVDDENHFQLEKEDQGASKDLSGSLEAPSDEHENNSQQKNKTSVIAESYDATAKFNEQFDQEVISLRQHLEEPTLKRLMGRQLKVHAVDIIRTFGSVESFIEAIRGLETLFYKKVKPGGTELQMAQFVVNSVRKRIRETNAAQL